MTGDTMTNAVKPLNLLIAEDHELARQGLVYSLQSEGNFKVVAQAENGEDAVAMAFKTQPDIVLMDIGMPVLDGITATYRIKENNPAMKVVILTSHMEGDEVYASLAVGADAYCLKDIRMERLIQVLQMVHEGAIWLDPGIARMVMSALPMKLPDKSRQAPNRLKYNVVLTDRELEVLSHIVEGKSNKGIAEELSITVHTVKAHVCSIIMKLAVDDRTQAAVKALRDGLIQKPM